MPVNKILEKETILMTHKIINTEIPQHLHYKMCVKYNQGHNTRDTRRTGHMKLGNTPKNIGKTKMMNYHFRMSAYKIYQ